MLNLRDLRIHQYLLIIYIEFITQRKKEHQPNFLL